MRTSKRRCLVILGLLSGLVAATVAAAAPVDRPDNLTCTFLGPEWEWPSVQVVIQDGSPLFGLREYYIEGDGSITVIDVLPDAESGAVETRYEAGRSADRVRKLIEGLCSGDSLREPPDHRAERIHTCSGPPRLYVRNKLGEVRSVAFPRDGRSADHEQAWLTASALREVLVGLAPVHEAPYVPGFVPPVFEDWAATLVLAGRPSRFSRPLSPEQRQRALEDYRRAEQIQLRRVAEEEGR